jgi:DNA-binding NarL/FixJ family response regulator
MPGGGGRNAMVGIKRRFPGSKTIVLSADHDRSTVLEMLQAGAVGYLVKGGSIDEIMLPSRARPRVRPASRSKSRVTSLTSSPAS